MREHLSRRSSVLAFSNEVAVLLNDESGGGDGNGRLIYCPFVYGRSRDEFLEDRESKSGDEAVFAYDAAEREASGRPGEPTQFW